MATVSDFSSMTLEELEAWAIERAMPAYRGRQLFRWLWRPGFDDFDQMSDFPKSLREQVADAGTMTRLEVVDKRVSVDGTIKLLWLLGDGLMVESVLIPERDHWTMCVSSQVGCRMGCAFCHTAKMGFTRNLTPSEIGGQVLGAAALMGRAGLRNLVFMGMGEPLDNYQNLVKAITILCDPSGLNFSPRRITVSTSGLVPEMLRLGRDLDVGLAVSLHAPSQDVRARLMPIAKRYELDTLIQGCRRYPLSRRRRITFEYLMLEGINDALCHARDLARLLRGIKAKVNLIPYNPSPGSPYRSPAREVIEAFQAEMARHNYTCMIRKSKGADILAACGQLHAKVSGECRRDRPC